jgi:hypothetical protein
MKINEIFILGERTINVGDYESRKGGYGITISLDKDEELEEAEKRAHEYLKTRLQRFEDGWKNPKRWVKETEKETVNPASPF